MKQDPYQLINDVHDQLADRDTDYQILSDYSTDPELWGYSKIWLFVSLLPAMLLLRISTETLSGWDQLYGVVGSFVLALAALAVTWATPSSMGAQDYFESIVSHFTKQNNMIHANDPDDSRLAPPPNTIVGQLRRLPLVRDLPLIGLETNPTQDLVAHNKPYRGGEYAIQRDDGAFIAAIQLKPIPLRLESEDEREKVERSVAKAIESSVDYDAQWYSPQRVADYGERRGSWNARSRELEEKAVRTGSTAPGDDDASAVDAIYKQIQADIAAERAAGINLYEKVKHIREFYLLVAVDPGEVVLDRSAEEGGLGSIPGVGTLVEKNRLRDQAGSPEHVDAMLRKLTRRVDNLSTALSRVDGLTTIPLSAMDFSEQVADYYRPTNVRAYNEFGAGIRGAPVPTDGAEADDPAYEVSWRHITNSLNHESESTSRETTATGPAATEPAATVPEDSPRHSTASTDEGVAMDGGGDSNRGVSE